MDEAELIEIEQRCLAATPGPWKSWVEGRDGTSGSNVILTGGEDFELIGVSVADQDFIAAARHDVPRLIAEIRRLMDEQTA